MIYCCFFTVRFLDVADLIPQMNPGGSGRILKPELRNVLNKMGFYMEDDDFEKLWLKYDTENYGTIRAERLMSKLGIAMRDTGSREESSSPKKLEVERKHSLDVERWLKRKFREGFSDMKHAFMELDLDRIGKVSRDEFRRVMEDFGLRLSTDKQLDDFLARFVCKRLLRFTVFSYSVCSVRKIKRSRHILIKRNLNQFC